MSTQLVIQYVVVGLIVAVSALVTFRKLAPQLTNRWLAAASIHFGRKRDSRMAQVLSQRLQPKQATGNCADGCATCGACGPKKPAAARPAETGTTVPLHFMPLQGRGSRGE